jgi:hypothetical protein
MNIFNTLGWIGAALMVSASFLMTIALGMALAIGGLFCLTVQAYHNKQNNLILLNLCSIIGVAHSLGAML